MDKGLLKRTSKTKKNPSQTPPASVTWIFFLQLNILYATGIQPVSATYIRFRTVLLQMLCNGTDKRF